MTAARARLAGAAGTALWLGMKAWRRRPATAAPCRDAAAEGPRAALEMAMHVLGHDLRAPQASMLALLELRRPSAPADAAVLAQIARHANTSLALIEDLLRLLRETRHAYHMTRFDLGELLAESADKVWAPARDAGVRLEVVPFRRLLRISADRARLAEVLEMLLKSAIAACRTGAVVNLCGWRVSGGTALRLTFTPVPERAAALSEPGPALLFTQRVLARHGGTLVPLQPLASEPDGTALSLDEGPESPVATEAGWYLWLPRSPRQK